ncbi:MAG: DUF4007 family protein [Pseudomonas sp.]
MLDQAGEFQQPRPSGERFSGHESFACRYGWLPKFYDLLTTDPASVRHDEQVMVSLGIGRNMVKSVRFWAQAFGLMEDGGKPSPTPTPFAHWLLDPKNGEDPYLEDVGSIWLLHWRLTATAHLAAWEVAFFETPEREILRRFLVQKVERRGMELEKRLSASTVRQHVEIFLGSYATPLSAAHQSVEEALACPLQELGLIRIHPAGDRDELIEFARGPWRHLNSKTLVRLLLDYWQLRAPHDRTLTLRALLTDFGSLGLTLRLDETSLWRMLTDAERAHPGIFELSDSLERRAVVLGAQDLAAARQRIGYR